MNLMSCYGVIFMLCKHGGLKCHSIINSIARCYSSVMVHYFLLIYFLFEFYLFFFIWFEYRLPPVHMTNQYILSKALQACLMIIVYFEITDSLTYALS